MKEQVGSGSKDRSTSFLAALVWDRTQTPRIWPVSAAARIPTFATNAVVLPLPGQATRQSGT